MSRKEVRVRAVSVIKPFEDAKVSQDDSTVIKVRTLKTSPKLAEKKDIYDQKLIDSYRSISGYGGMSSSMNLRLDIVDDGKDQNKMTGIVFRAPDIPRMQKATVERILGLYAGKK